jgi:hypothetical protein
MTTSSNTFSGDLSKSTEAIQCPGATARWCRASSSTGGMEASVLSLTGLREHRIRLSGLSREYQRKSAFQWVPSVVLCAASWTYARPEFAVK